MHQEWVSVVWPCARSVVCCGGIVAVIFCFSFFLFAVPRFLLFGSPCEKIYHNVYGVVIYLQAPHQRKVKGSDEFFIFRGFCMVVFETITKNTTKKQRGLAPFGRGGLAALFSGCVDA